MSPEALIAVATVAKTVVVQTVSSLYKVPLTPEETKELCKFSEVEQKSLETLAPFAADYTANLEQYAKPAMALLFGGVVMISTMASIRVIRSKIPPKPRNVIKPNANPRKTSGRNND